MHVQNNNERCFGVNTDSIPKVANRVYSRCTYIVNEIVNLQIEYVDCGQFCAKVAKEKLLSLINLNVDLMVLRGVCIESKLHA